MGLGGCRALLFNLIMKAHLTERAAIIRLWQREWLSNKKISSSSFLLWQHFLEKAGWLVKVVTVAIFVLNQTTGDCVKNNNETFVLNITLIFIGGLYHFLLTFCFFFPPTTSNLAFIYNILCLIFCQLMYVRLTWGLLSHPRNSHFISQYVSLF